MIEAGLHHHDHEGRSCCPVHEPLTDLQVRDRLRLALVAGALLAAGEAAVRLSGQAFAGTMIEVLACAGLAGPLFKDAWSGLRRGRMGFPCLVALAYAACLSQGEYLTAGLVAFFMIMADQLENRTAIGAGRAIEALIRTTPNHVRVLLAEGRVENRPLADLRQGDVIRVLPGEMVPVDGLIAAGESSLDESSMTGESRPLDKSAGTWVYAGTTNLTGALDVRVERLGEDTTLGRVKKLILSAAASKSPFMSVMEKHAGWYTPLVLLWAMLAFYFQQGRPGALNLAIAILIMACPCSLVLAAPSAMIAAVTAAARAGVLVKNVVELENFHRVDHVFFDKTGTLTTGQLAVVDVDLCMGADLQDVLAWSAGLARNSNHPGARGVAEYCGRDGVRFEPFNQVVEVPGRGLRGSNGGDSFYLGRGAWIRSELGLPAAGDDMLQGTVLVLAAARRGLLATFQLQDQLRPDARDSLLRLRELGVQRMSLLTGDGWEPARRVASEVGFDQVHAKCLPEDKLARLNEARRSGERTAVIGDGINDAPVLAAGDVGIAMGVLGSQVAIESASVALMTTHLDRLPFLYQLSRRARRTIWMNVIMGLAVMTCGLLFFFFFQGNPVAAAILHNLSAFAILFNSARLVNLRP